MVIFGTTVNFEFEYFLDEESEGVLTDTLINFHDWHLTLLTQIKHNIRVIRWDSPFNTHSVSGPKRPTPILNLI